MSDRDVTLPEMVAAMAHLKDDETFRYFQTSSIGSNGRAQADDLLRLTVGEARKAVEKRKPTGENPIYRLIDLAREGYSRGWDGLDSKERLDEINALSDEMHRHPVLVEIDLSKATSKPGAGATWHDHPDIRTDGTQYLALIGDRMFCGTFTEEHYGKNFVGWTNPVGLQFDKPGTNASRWQRLWRID